MRRWPRKEPAGSSLHMRLRRLTDAELTMVGESSMFNLGRAFNNPNSDRLADAAQELEVLGAMVAVLRTRH